MSDVGNDGEPFEATIYSVWWNAFHDQESGRPGEWAGVRLDYPAAAVNESMLLPPSKQLKSWGFSAFPKDTDRPLPSEQSPGSFVDRVHGKLYWEIPEPKQDWVYRIDWSWQDR